MTRTGREAGDLDFLAEAERKAVVINVWTWRNQTIG